MAGNYDLIVDQGATFTRIVTVYDSTGAIVTINGYSAQLEVRPNAQDTGTPLLNLTSPATITINGTAGTITFTFTATQTGLLPTSLGPLAWELVLTAPDGTTKVSLIKGRVLMSASVVH